MHPREEFYNSRVYIEAEASDPDGILEVKYRIDNGSWRTLEDEGAELFSSSWTPLGDGWHWLDISAEDNQGYVSELSVRFETDSTPPFIFLNSVTDKFSAIA